MRSTHKHQANRDFITEHKPTLIPYNPILDKNLHYYFANRNNCKILIKNQIINHRNQLLDKSLTKAVQAGLVSLNPTFKIRHRKTNPNKTMSNHNHSRKKKSESKGLEKEEFLEYL